MVDIRKHLIWRNRLVQKPAEFLVPVSKTEFQDLFPRNYRSNVSVVISVGLTESGAVVEVATCPDADDQIKNIPVGAHVAL